MPAVLQHNNCPALRELKSGGIRPNQEADLSAQVDTDRKSNSNKTSRREILRHGSVLAGSAIAGAVLPETARAAGDADKNLPPSVPEWMQTPGADVGSQPYGTPSPFEKSV